MSCRCATTASSSPTYMSVVTPRSFAIAHAAEVEWTTPEGRFAFRVCRATAEAPLAEHVRAPLEALEPDVTPLVDVMLVLLIIFMITTPLLESSMNLVIPSTGTKNPPINTSHVQTVSIDRTNTIRFNNQVMDLETLTTQLVQLKQANPDIAIVIRPDRDLPVQKLIGVMDALQRAGVTKVGIATKAEPN